MSSEVLRCPACRSVQVEALADDHRCRVCGTTWHPAVRTRKTAGDYVGALRRDRFERQESGTLWDEES